MDRCVAPVTVSVVSVDSSGSASVATVEFMDKVNAAEKDSLVKSLALDWQSVLQTQPAIQDAAPPAHSDYWETLAGSFDDSCPSQ